MYEDLSLQLENAQKAASDRAKRQVSSFGYPGMQMAVGKMTSPDYTGIPAGAMSNAYGSGMDYYRRMFEMQDKLRQLKLQQPEAPGVGYGMGILGSVGGGLLGGMMGKGGSQGQQMWQKNYGTSTPYYGPAFGG